MTLSKFRRRCLTGLAVLAFLPAPAAAQVPYARLTGSDSEPDAWLTYSGNYRSERFSRLDRIHRGNVHRLRPSWIHQTGTAGRVEVTPLVADGVMYIAEPPSTIAALDARTGRTLWRHDPGVPDETLNIGFPRVNRGVALLDDSVFFGTLDAFVMALDRSTGDVRWRVPLGDNRIGVAITAAPLAVDGKVIVGMSGGEAGVRGFLDAYDAETGERRWRFWAVPEPDEPGGDTWEGDTWKTGGGATWLTGSFDPELGLLYWGIGNPAPDWNGDRVFPADVGGADRRERSGGAHPGDGSERGRDAGVAQSRRRHELVQPGIRSGSESPVRPDPRDGLLVLQERRRVRTGNALPRRRRARGRGRRDLRRRAPSTARWRGSSGS